MKVNKLNGLSKHEANNVQVERESVGLSSSRTSLSVWFYSAIRGFALQEREREKERIKYPASIKSEKSPHICSRAIENNIKILKI